MVWSKCGTVSECNASLNVLCLWTLCHFSECNCILSPRTPVLSEQWLLMRHFSGSIALQPSFVQENHAKRYIIKPYHPKIWCVMESVICSFSMEQDPRSRSAAAAVPIGHPSAHWVFRPCYSDQPTVTLSSERISPLYASPC